jgi:uncharacterized protein (DUF1800 family)
MTSPTGTLGRSTLDRRQVVVGSAAVAAATGIASTVGAPSAQAAVGSTIDPRRYASRRRTVMPRDWRTLLLRRAAWGPNAATMNDLAARGTAAAWLDWQLAASTVSDPMGSQIDALYPEMAWSITQARAGIQQFSWDLMMLTAQYQVARAVWSRRQLFEVMVDFWHNHLHVAVPSDGLWDNSHNYDRTVIRAHALGKFSDMLLASAKHPSMLYYLNNASSTKDAPNENYGRELLELHTVGVDGGYTETMMYDCARVLTGWTVDDNTGLAVYDPTIHWTGSVKILNWTNTNSAEDGRAAVDSLLLYLARHPKTAERLATKLVTRFVSDAPSPALVSRLAATYLAHDTDIRPVIRQLFLSPEFAMSYERKVKRPMEDVISTVRILGHTPLTTGTLDDRRKGIQALYWQMQDLRQAPLDWDQPNGYPDTAAAWQSADGALGRWNNHQSLVAGWWPNKDIINVPLPQKLLPTTLPTTAGGLVDALSNALFHGRLRPEHRAAVLAFMGLADTATLAPSNQWLQWRLAELVALMLDSPAHTLR